MNTFGVIIIAIVLCLGVSFVSAILLVSILQGVKKNMLDLKERYIYIGVVNIITLLYFINLYNDLGSFNSIVFFLTYIVTFYLMYKYTKEWD